MTETPGLFPASDGSPLYGVFHSPVGPARVPILVAPGLFEERKSAYAVLTGLSRTLAQAGHPVLRFDYRGSGESGGDCTSRRWADLAEDLQSAQSQLARCAGPAEPVLVGLRLGASLCLQAYHRAPAPRGVVAIAPVLQGAAETKRWTLRSRIRAELTSSASKTPGVREANSGTEVLDLDGFSVAPQFIDDLAALDLLRDPPTPASRILLIQVSHRTDPAPEMERLREALGSGAALECMRLEPFWDRVDAVDPTLLYRAVLDFSAR